MFSIVIVYSMLNSFGFPVGAAELVIALLISTAGIGNGSHTLSDAVGTPSLTAAQFSKPVPLSPISRLQSVEPAIIISTSTVNITSISHTSTASNSIISLSLIRKLDTPS